MELRIDKLTKEYKDKTAVNDFSISLNQGVYGLLGANGAGKTTLMRMICGILNPTRGTVMFNNVDCKCEEYRDVLGYLPQDFGYYPEFTGMDFLLYMSSLKGLTKSKAIKKSKELLELVSLTDMRNKKIKTYSGGMKQRLGIAQALLNDPKILVLDEPTAGLDPKERIKFRNIIANLATQRIVILSTHIVSDVESIADEILIMKNGNLIMQGTVTELIKEAEGKVFSLVTNEEELDNITNNYTIANIHHSGKDVNVRIISDKELKNGFIEDPTLEDVYMYCMSYK